MSVETQGYGGKIKFDWVPNGGGYTLTFESIIGPYKRNASNTEAALIAEIDRLRESLDIADRAVIACEEEIEFLRENGNL